MLKKFLMIGLATTACLVFADDVRGEEEAPPAAAEAAPAAAEAAPAVAAAPSPGQVVFETQKCNSCHAIEVLGIPIVDAEEIEEGEKTPPDLSHAGAEHTKQFIAAYLMKKKTIEDKKHKKRFRGTPEELKTVAIWLSEMK